MLTGCSSETWHLSSKVESVPSPLAKIPDSKTLSFDQAVSMGVARLQERDVHDIVICRFHWMVAPFGAAVMDAIGERILDGVRYTNFRIGVRDGSDFDPAVSQTQAGAVAFYIAHGVRSGNERVWDPAPGPGATSLEGPFVPEYEFLTGTKDIRNFENLQSDCESK